MKTRTKLLYSIVAVVVSAAVTGHALPARADAVQYARAIGEPPEPAPRPAPIKKPPERTPTSPAEPAPTAATEEEGGVNPSYIWIGLGVAAALAALGGGGGGGGSTPSHQ